MLYQSCYRILNISPDATRDEIKQAYRALALRWHPDRHLDSAKAHDAARRFLEVQEAYQMLMRHPYPLGTVLSPPMGQRTVQRTDSTLSYQSRTCSSSRLGSFIHLSASSMDSLVTPASTVKSSAPSYTSSLQICQENNSTGRFHPLQYANNDQTWQKRASPFPPRLFRHSTENLMKHSNAWLNHTPSLPKYNTTKSTQESRAYTIVSPSSQPSPSLPPFSWDEYLLREHHKTSMFHSLGIGPAKEWVYSLFLTLEELLNGKHCAFSLSRRLLSGRMRNVVLEIDIPPGCRKGVRILCRGVGHERKDGSFQDIAFIVEEIAHHSFLRCGDNLCIDIKITWEDSFRHRAREFAIEGLDGQKLHLRVDYPRAKVLKGESVIRRAGMPIRCGGKVIGRGNLLVRWEILPHHPRVLSFMKKFMYFRRQG